MTERYSFKVIQLYALTSSSSDEVEGLYEDVTKSIAPPRLTSPLSWETLMKNWDREVANHVWDHIAMGVETRVTKR